MKRASLAFKICLGGILLIAGGCDYDPAGPSDKVSTTPEMEVQIEKVHGALQGHYVEVDITLSKLTEILGGFDLLIGYDTAGLSFTEAHLGDYFDSCGWEYFTYYRSPNNDCDSNCPTGLLHLIGQADIRGFSDHPDTTGLRKAAGQTLASMTFLVTNDRDYECAYFPIRFYWFNCGDNSMPLYSYDTIAMPRSARDTSGTPVPEDNDTLPGSYSPPENCVDTTGIIALLPLIDYSEGGISLICDTIPQTSGDLNCNGIRHEVADAVLYSQFFVGGETVFDPHLECSINASDVNMDGMNLTVSDLQYQIRIVVGDAPPYGHSGDTMQFTVGTAQVGNTFTVKYESDSAIGIAYLVIGTSDSTAAPTLGEGADGMDLKYAWREGRLFVLIHYIGGGHSIAAGSHILVTVPSKGLTSLFYFEAADYYGYPLKPIRLPW